MRIDLFLKKSRLIKERSLAKTACDAGHVLVDDIPAKPAKTIQAGQIIKLMMRDKILEVKILEIPVGNVSKARANTLYQTITEQKI